ncbi:MAG: tripartite tricarboxylate transporter substrate binding protein [Betaproteobacteria bacterium]|nr:tripartite tricarboxylate transporter substrate binding protein [Betaproteobacteria bacterium]
MELTAESTTASTARFIARFITQFITIAGLLAASAASFAQAWPARPVRLILNVSVGVFGDIVMRAGALELQRQTGQPWVVENRSGGNFVIGANACKAAAPDGYSVCMVNEQTMSTNPHTITQLSYDPEKDFTPVTNLFIQVSAIAVASEYGSLGELHKAATAKGKGLNFATLGPGSSQDILRQWLNARWKTQMTEVPYKAMGPIMTGIASGDIAATITSIGSAASFVAGGKARFVAVNSSKRLPKHPEAPTFDEVALTEYQGLKGHTWWGLMAPAGTPDPVIRRINAEMAQLFREAKFQELLESQALEPAIGTPEQFAAFLKEDRARGALVVKRFNIPKQ